MDTVEIPLFPLRTVLFPGGLLPLRIFEQRYLTLVKNCARDNSGFGVCLIREGEEAVSPVRTAGVGTQARIVDWYTLEGGLLGVSVIGTVRFIVDASWQRPDGLHKATVTIVPEPPPCELPESFAVLGVVLSRLLEKVGQLYPDFTSENLQDAVWVGYRLSELLPISGIERQHLLELADPIERLQSLLDLLPRFQLG